jgi:hypothetical protein
MNEQQKTDLNMRVEVYQTHEGEFLWKKDVVAEYAFLICSGDYELLQAGKEVNLKKGQLVGDFPAIIRDHPTKSALKCSFAGELLRIRKHHLEKFLMDNPGLFIYLKDKLIVN